jgi:hypothetical protein
MALLYVALGERGRAKDGGDLYMAAVDDVDELIEQYHQALDEFMKGSPEG